MHHASKDKHGQAALEFLMTYGWAFLVMTAVIAGFVVVDPFSAAPEIHACTTTGIYLSCDSTTVRSNADDISLRVDGTGRETRTVSDAKILAVNGDNRSGRCFITEGRVSDDTSARILCDDAGFTPGETNTVRAEITSYDTDVGPKYTRDQVVELRFTPGEQDIGGSRAAPNDLSAVLNSMNGSGSKDNPYKISDVRELQAMNAAPDAHFELVSDVEALGTEDWNAGKGFDPIDTGDYYDGFTGSFDGNDHTVLGLTINRSSATNVGLFARVGKASAKVENMGLRGVDIRGGTSVGALTGYLRNSNATGITVTGEVHGETKAGGIAGRLRNDALLASSTTTITVTGNTSGGIAGFSRGDSRIESVSSSGTVNGDDTVGGIVGGTGGSNEAVQDVSTTVRVVGKNDVGGVAGSVRGPVRDATSTGKVTGDKQVGGVIGHLTNHGNITGSHHTGTVVGDEQVGGLIGYSQADVTKSGSKGPVRGDNMTGGLIGRAKGCAAVIKNAYALSAVGGKTRTGGLIGEGDCVGVVTSFSTGSVNATSTVGGIIGHSQYVGGNDNYWDNTTTTVAYDTGNQGDKPQHSSLPKNNMTGLKAASSMNGFNFTSVWTTTNGYPRLR